MGTGELDQMTATGKAATRTGLALVPLGVALFASAGDLGWAGAWCYIGLLLASTGLSLFGPVRLDEGLIEERLGKPKAGAALWDRIFVGLVGVFTLAELLVPGFDRRWGWTREVEDWELWLGLFAVAAGTAGIMWAMRTNRFFSTVIRIQSDRGHHVVEGGPYRFVRHPGYAFWGARTLGAPLLLGSHWAFLVAVPFLGMLVVRTLLEDRLLSRELPGYSEYAARTRWRLVPLVW